MRSAHFWAERRRVHRSGGSWTWSSALMKRGAGPRGEALRPEVALLPLMVAAFADVVDPRQPRLGADPIEPREALEQLGKNEIGNELGDHRGRWRRHYRVVGVRRVPLPVR